MIFLNHFLSLGIDNIWRRKAINELKGIEVNQLLDVACGTGDLAIAGSKLDPEKIIGVDISTEMLRTWERKNDQEKNGSSL